MLEQPTIRSCLQQAALSLQAAGIDTAQREARLLMALCLDWRFERVWRDEDQKMPMPYLPIWHNMVSRRCQHEPFARLAGRREFWSMSFALSDAVLEPRPDSETLVEAALRHMPRKNGTVLDLGVGSGCLLAAMLKELPDASGYGVDCSIQACLTARKNMRRCGIDNRTKIICGDWATALAEPFDLILSNPPYITTSQLNQLPFAAYEPRCALDGGQDGLDAYRNICKNIQHILTFHSQFIIEIGNNMAEAVTTLLQTAGLRCHDRAYDLGGNLRALIAMRAKGAR